MTDDHDRLTTLFAQAAGDPPPGFDHDTVVARSRQVTARRRSVLLGSAAVLAVVVGVSVVVGQPRTADETATTAAAPPAAERAEDAAEAAAPMIAQGAGAAAPLGAGTAECVDRNDPALRALVDQVLPAVAGAPEAAVTALCQPGGTREVNLDVGGGRFTVVSLPPGEEAPNLQEAAFATARTASLGTVVVRSVGDGTGTPAPFADRLQAVADALAPLL